MSTPSTKQTIEIKTTDEIRSEFPALERVHNGHSVAYFDAPGGTQTPQVVVDAVSDYLLNHNANTHWEYPNSHETDAILESARHTFADFLNAESNEIAFGPNTTTMIYHLSRALGRTLGPGDEVVITELEHHANVAPWQALVVERGITLNVAQMDTESGQLDWSDFERLVTNKTKVVAFGAGCNALGTVNRFRDAVELAHSVGALALVDAVHYAPYFLCDVKEMNCDFLTCSGYKFYGPHMSVLSRKSDAGARASVREGDITKHSAKAILAIVDAYKTGRGQQMLCREIMTPNPEYVLPSDTVMKAAQLMKSENVGPIPIVDDKDGKKLTGIITDRDLAIKVVAEARDARTTLVNDVMSGDLVTCKENEDVREALKLMQENQVRRIPVVDNSHQLLGIISQADVATRLGNDQATGQVVEDISH